MELIGDPTLKLFESLIQIILITVDVAYKKN